MRTKKTYIKDSVITRTIPVTTVTYVTVDMDTMAVKEETTSLVLDYNEKEAIEALREKGINVAGIKAIDVVEYKVSMSTSSFFQPWTICSVTLKPHTMGLIWDKQRLFMGL